MGSRNQLSDRVTLNHLRHLAAIKNTFHFLTHPHFLYQNHEVDYLDRYFGLFGYPKQS